MFIAGIGSFFDEALAFHVDAGQRGFHLSLMLLQAVQNCFIVTFAGLVIIELHTCIFQAQN